MNPVLNWLARKFGRRMVLAPEQKMHFLGWQALPQVELDTPFETARYVVVDVETSGLNVRRDKLISIGAVAVINGRIALGESFYMVLQQEAVSERENILLHEISGSEQREGAPAADVLLKFLDFVGKDPLLAFHVAFDKTMIRRAISQHLGFNFKHPWLDLAYVMPGLNTLLASRFKTLDHWCDHFDIKNDIRHNALTDALATAQLFLVAMQQAGKKNIHTYRGMAYVEKLQRSLGGY